MPVEYEAVGAEFQVNTYSTGMQTTPAITALSGGGFVVTWQSFGQDGSEWGIYGQRYDSAGNPQGDEFQVNSYTDSSQLDPSVTAFCDGGFVVTWTSSGQDGDALGIFGQRYDSAGNPQGSEFQVNSYAPSAQFASSVTAIGDGGFVVTWQSFGQDGDSYGIFGQRYDSSGNPQGDEFQVNSYTTSQQGAPAVTALGDSGFVVTWQSSGQDGSGFGIFGQRYDSGGNPVGSEFQANSYTPSNQNGVTVTALGGGGFVVAWMSFGQDGNGNGIYGQRYDSDGNPVGGEFQVNSYTASDQIGPTVTALGDGSFVVSWTSRFQDGSGYGVFGQRYDSDGNPVGTEFQINSFSDSEQYGPTVTPLADGGFAIAWTSDVLDGSNHGIFAQLFSPVPADTTPPDAPTIAQTSPESDTMPNLGGTAEAGSTVTIRDGGGNFVAAVLADDTGNWTYEFDSAFADGDYVFSATAMDAAGNVSESASLIVSVVVTGNSVNGGNGADTIDGTDGRDTLNGGNGTDTLSGGWAPDELFGGNGDDILLGGAGADFLYGENGSDSLYGGIGNDILDGGRGDDELTGGAGFDSFVIGRTGGNDTITDFQVGIDRLQLEDELTVASLQSVGGDTLVSLSNGAVVTLEGITLASAEDLFPVFDSLAMTGMFSTTHEYNLL